MTALLEACVHVVCAVYDTVKLSDTVGHDSTLEYFVCMCVFGIKRCEGGRAPVSCPWREDKNCFAQV